MIHNSIRQIFSNSFFFFFNDTATTEIYTLSLHDALPICPGICSSSSTTEYGWRRSRARADRKSTRLNSSHDQISYAVFCLKKKKQKTNHYTKQNCKPYITLKYKQHTSI